MSSRVVLIVAISVAAVAVAGAVIAASLVGARGGGTEAASGPGFVPGAAELAGIPQQGTALGRATAPRTLVVYGDVQCPYCAMWDQGVLPGIVDSYVRDGKLRVVFRGLAFIGPESELGLRAVLAAGLQNQAWSLLDLLYANQGQENGGWLNEDTLRRLGSGIPGLDVDRMIGDLNASQVDAEISSARVSADAAGVGGTPSFQLGPTGGALKRVAQQDLDSALAG